MEIKAVGFFEENKFAFKKMLERGLDYGLTETQIHAGMVAVYKRVQGGEKIKQIQLAREAFAEARKVNEEEFAERIKRYVDIDLRFREVEDRLERLDAASLGFRLRRWWLGRSNF